MKEKKEPVFDPKGRYLINNEGAVYVYSEALAARKDMRPYDPATKTTVVEANASTPGPAQELVKIELQGRPFTVDANLAGVLAEMVDKMEELREENTAYGAKMIAWDAHKERLETDIFDLTEQLEKAKAELEAANQKIAEMSKPPEQIPPNQGAETSPDATGSGAPKEDATGKPEKPKNKNNK